MHLYGPFATRTVCCQGSHASVSITAHEAAQRQALLPTCPKAIEYLRKKRSDVMNATPSALVGHPVLDTCSALFCRDKTSLDRGVAVQLERQELNNDETVVDPSKSLTAAQNAAMSSTRRLSPFLLNMLVGHKSVSKGRFVDKSQSYPQTYQHTNLYTL